jgi:hypothetical protein
MKANHKGMVVPVHCAHVKLWAKFRNQSHAVQHTLTYKNATVRTQTTGELYDHKEKALTLEGLKEHLS